MNRRSKEMKKKARAERISDKRISARVSREKTRKTKKVNATQLGGNAKMISNAMITENVKGNYKDYVLVVGSSLIDWKKSYNIKIKRPPTASPGEILLVHKKDLKNILPPDQAADFWHPKLGRLGAKV